MKTLKIATIIGVTILAATLLISTAAAACGPWGGTFGYGGGIMSGNAYGYNYNTPYTNQPTTATPETQYYQPVFPFMFGGGCFGGFGWNGPYTNAVPYNSENPIDIATAGTIAQNYVTALNNPDLTVNHIEEYTANFYVQVNEQSTGNGAFELLINKYTGSIYPEMGPNMMWNIKYGMMRGGILGGIFGSPTATMPVTVTQAQTDAQQYLTTYILGATTGDITTFYGYYTIEVLNNGNTYGMLSINGYTGQVWFHTWHGTFVQELQVS